MEVLVYLVPLALGLGALGLAGFLWSLKDGQFDDPDGAAWRAIAEMRPISRSSCRSAWPISRRSDGGAPSLCPS